MLPSILRLGSIRRYDRHSYLCSVVPFCLNQLILLAQGARIRCYAHLLAGIRANFVHRSSIKTESNDLYTLLLLAANGSFSSAVRGRDPACSPAESTKLVDGCSLRAVLVPSYLGPLPAVIASEANSPQHTKHNEYYPYKYRRKNTIFVSHVVMLLFTHPGLRYSGRTRGERPMSRE